MNRKHEVVKGLFIGNEDTPHSWDFDVIISVGAEFKNLYKTIERNKSADFYCINIYDDEEEPIEKYFKKSANTIEKNLTLGKTVLVHCGMGVSRSAAIIIAYLMLKHNMTYDLAFTLLKKLRPCINPNSGFVKKLKALEN